MMINPVYGSYMAGVRGIFKMSEQLEEFKIFICHIQSLNLQGKTNEINAKIKSMRLLYDF